MQQLLPGHTWYPDSGTAHSGTASHSPEDSSQASPGPSFSNCKMGRQRDDSSSVLSWCPTLLYAGSVPAADNRLSGEGGFYFHAPLQPTEK